MYCPRQTTWSMTARGVKRQAGQGGSTAHAALSVFCLFQKHYRKTGRTMQFLLSKWAKWSVEIFNRNKLQKNTQNLTLTDVILLRETTYSCFQHSRYFWHRYNAFWPFRSEPSSGRTARLQLCAVLGNCRINLPEYICSLSLLFTYMYMIFVLLRIFSSIRQ